jgi:hypothetical protein
MSSYNWPWFSFTASPDYIGGPVMGAPHRLAVDGHHFALGDLGHGLDPLNKTALELLRVQASEDVSESIMGGDAVGQLQEGLEPLLFIRHRRTEKLDIHP